jgi:hypothetical protein
MKTCLDHGPFIDIVSKDQCRLAKDNNLTDSELHNVLC